MENLSGFQQKKGDDIRGIHKILKDVFNRRYSSCHHRVHVTSSANQTHRLLNSSRAPEVSKDERKCVFKLQSYLMENESGKSGSKRLVPVIPESKSLAE